MMQIVMMLYNLIEYSDNYPGTTGSLWQYHKGKPRNSVTDSNSFKSNPSSVSVALI